VPSFGKPVSVMRKITERPEGIEAGTAKLVGFENEKIYSETMRLLEDKTYIRVWPRQKIPMPTAKQQKGL